MKSKIVLPYAPILVESTRSIGYSFEAALADIIDNSLGKSATEVNILFSSKDPQCVAIIDNGAGMSEAELESAMRYGSKSSLDERDKNDLGRFGLGLKTASFDRIVDGAANAQKVFDERIERARSHVALVFHRYMDNENIKARVKISFNHALVEPIDPFLIQNPATQPLTEQTLRIDGSMIKVKPYILPYSSKVSAKDKKKLGDLCDLRSNQGFYIYRNKRLIIWGTWFRLIKTQELNKLARIRVDIPNTLDSIWGIDIKKSTASLPDVIKRNLVAVVENSVGRSERVYKYRGRNAAKDHLQHIWETIDNRGKFQYQINRELPIVKLLEESLDDRALGYLDSFIKTIEDAFPYGDVYYRLARDENAVDQTGMEFEEVYKVAKNMIAAYKEMGGDIRTFLETLDKIDYFIKYPDVVKKVREDYKQ